MKKINVCANYEVAFAEPINSLGFKEGIFGYRVKTIRSGKMTEIGIFPIWKKRADYSRAAKVSPSREIQEQLNERNSIKRLTRLLNANFDESDIWLTLTYDKEHLPADEHRAYRDTVNYIRALRKRFAQPIKYIIVTETHTTDGEPTRIHHHVVTNFKDRDTAEKLWKKGRTQARRLQPDENGFEGMANYLGKQKKSSKRERQVTRRWRCSTKLARPKVTVSDHKVSRRAVEKIVKCSEEERKIKFEKLYKKDRYIDCQVRYSAVVAGVYIYVKMRRVE